MALSLSGVKSSRETAQTAKLARNVHGQNTNSTATGGLVAGAAVAEKQAEIRFPEFSSCRARGLVPEPGELQSPTRRGQVHVFGQGSLDNFSRSRRKMDQTPDFAVLLAPERVLRERFNEVFSYPGPWLLCI